MGLETVADREVVVLEVDLETVVDLEVVVLEVGLETVVDREVVVLETEVDRKTIKLADLANLAPHHQVQVDLEVILETEVDHRTATIKLTDLVNLAPHHQVQDRVILEMVVDQEVDSQLVNSTQDG